MILTGNEVLSLEAGLVAIFDKPLGIEASLLVRQLYRVVHASAEDVRAELRKAFERLAEQSAGEDKPGIKVNSPAHEAYRREEGEVLAATLELALPGRRLALTALPEKLITPLLISQLEPVMEIEDG